MIRKRAKKAVGGNRQARQDGRLQHAIEHLAEPICLCDRDGRIVVVNAAWRAVNAAVIGHAQPGMMFERHLRAGLRIGNYPDAVGRESQWLAERMARHRGGSAPLEQRRQDGKWLLLRDEKLPDGGTLTFSLDITERKLAEQKRAKSEARFKALSDLSSDWYWEQDENFRFTDFSLDVEREAGSSVGSHVGKTRWELPAVGVSEEAWAAHRAMLEAHQPFRDFEYQRTNEHGELIWMVSSGIPVFDAAGRFKGYRGIGRNISERKRAEAEVAHTKLRLDAALVASNAFAFEYTPATGTVMLFHSPKRGGRGSVATVSLEESLASVHAEDREPVRGGLEMLGNGARRSIEIEYRVHREGGGWTWRRMRGEGLDHNNPATEKAARVVGTSVDITVHKRAEEAQRTSEQQMRALLDGIPDRAWLKDAQGRYVAINRAEEGAHGVPAARILGKHVSEFRPVSEAEGVEVEDRRAMAAAGPLRFERKSNLGDSWREIIKAPIRNAYGEVIGLVGISRDITERKRVEQALANAKERLQRAMEGSNLALWETNLRTGEVYLSEGWAELLGTPLGETRTTVNDLMKFVHPADLENLVRMSRETVKGKRADYSAEHRVRTQGGEWKWIRSSGKVSERDAAGRALRMTGTNLDITARKIAEIALHESEARFRSLTSLSSDWYWEQDENFRFTFMSGQLREKTGIDVGEHLGKTRWDMPAPNVSEADWQRHRVQLERHEPFVDFVMRRPDRDGRAHWVSISGEPMFDELKRFRGYRGIGRDITEAHLVRERIESMNAQLEERVRARTTELEALVKELEMFNYAVAHDLHTSLGVMSVNAGMLLNDLGGRLAEDHRRALGRITDNAQLTAKLLDDLIEYSRLGRVALESTPVAMRELSRNAWRKLARAEPNRQLLFEAGELPGCSGDARMLSQLWAGLLSNALKFTRTREQTRIEAGYSTAQKAYFVRDNGVGFDMQHAGKLFGLFERLHRDERFEGTGVGLALAARIVRRHGGRIWAEARLDEGATFFFTIP